DGGRADAILPVGRADGQRVDARRGDPVQSHGRAAGPVELRDELPVARQCRRGPGGTLSDRITNDSQSSSDMSNQITDMEQTLTDQQTALQAQFAAMETAIQQSQATESYLSGQISSLSSSTTS